MRSPEDILAQNEEVKSWSHLLHSSWDRNNFLNSWAKALAIIGPVHNRSKHHVWRTFAPLFQVCLHNRCMEKSTLQFWIMNDQVNTTQHVSLCSQLVTIVSGRRVLAWFGFKYGNWDGALAHRCSLQTWHESIASKAGRHSLTAYPEKLSF